MHPLKVYKLYYAVLRLYHILYNGIIKLNIIT
jgi:hypothetical protein